LTSNLKLIHQQNARHATSIGVAHVQSRTGDCLVGLAVDLTNNQMRYMEENLFTFHMIFSAAASEPST
jgi:hypothetical protein